jgi:hypothetical protein
MAVEARGAGGAALSVEERLSRGPFFRGDTRTLVGSLLLAVAFSANMQITERIDQIWTGGLGVPLGHTFAEVWWPTAAIYFGGTGALIVANFNPIIAVLSATHPLAWSFFFLNMTVLFIEAFAFRAWFRTHNDVSIWVFCAIVSVADLITSIEQLIGLNIIVLKLSFNVSAVLFFWQWLMATFIGGPMGYAFYRAVRRSGVFAR